MDVDRREGTHSLLVSYQRPRCQTLSGFIFITFTFGDELLIHNVFIKCNVSVSVVIYMPTTFLCVLKILSIQNEDYMG